MKKLLVGSLLCMLSTTVMAETLSQVMPGTWDSQITLQIDPHSVETAPAPTELRLTRSNGSVLTAHSINCESEEFGKAAAPLMQDAYNRHVMVDINMKMQVEFNADGKTKALSNVEYTVAGNPMVARCFTLSNDQTGIDDEHSQLVDTATGTRTDVQIISHDEIIVK